MLDGGHISHQPSEMPQSYIHSGPDGSREESIKLLGSIQLNIKLVRLITKVLLAQVRRGAADNVCRLAHDLLLGCYEPWW